MTSHTGNRQAGAGRVADIRPGYASFTPTTPAGGWFAARCSRQAAIKPLRADDAQANWPAAWAEAQAHWKL